MLKLANVARPLLSVVCDAKDRNPGNRATATGFNCSATATPAVWTALPKLSSSCTVTGGVMFTPAAESVGCWMKASFPAVAARLVRLKAAGAVAPAVDAVTWNDPSTPLAVIVGEVAIPLASATTVGELLKVTLGPVPGAAKVTEA